MENVSEEVVEGILNLLDAEKVSEYDCEVPIEHILVTQISRPSGKGNQYKSLGP